MPRLFEPSSEIISREWLESIADEIDGNWAYFVIEEESEGGFNDGYVKVRCEFPDGLNDTTAIEILNGVATSDGMLETSVCAGLFKFKDDLTCLMEILSRGSHGF